MVGSSIFECLADLLQSEPFPTLCEMSLNSVALMPHTRGDVLNKKSNHGVMDQIDNQILFVSLLKDMITARNFPPG